MRITMAIIHGSTCRWAQECNKNMKAMKILSNWNKWRKLINLKESMALLYVLVFMCTCLYLYNVSKHLSKRFFFLLLVCFFFIVSPLQNKPTLLYRNFLSVTVSSASDSEEIEYIILYGLVLSSIVSSASFALSATFLWCPSCFYLWTLFCQQH